MKKVADFYTVWSIVWRLFAYCSSALFALMPIDNLKGLMVLPPIVVLVLIMVVGTVTALLEHFWNGAAKHTLLNIVDFICGIIMLTLYPCFISSLILSLPVMNGFKTNKSTGYALTLTAAVIFIFGGIIISSLALSHDKFLNPSLLTLGIGILFIAFFCGNLYAYLSRQEERTEALISLIQVGQELGVTSSLQKVLTMGLNVVKALFPCHSCVVYLRSSEESEMNLVRVKAYSSKIPEAFVDFNMDITPSLVGKVIKENTGMIMDNFSGDPREDVIPKDKGFRAMMISPLSIEDKSIGSLMVAHTVPDFYTQEDLRLYTMLSNQIALAVRNIQIQETMGAMAITDSLSGLYTHGFFQENLSKELTKAKYENKSASILIIDVDFFKKINDTYGHPQGDSLLKQLGGVLRSVARKEDILCRYGGDEFTVTMTNTNRISAVILAEKIRTTVEEYEFVLKGQVAHITISGGVASFPEDAQTKKELIECSDKALYQAKQAGRNKISFGVSKK
jgi:diguanylate cyclase (GGDEF)-like protein